MGGGQNGSGGRRRKCEGKKGREGRHNSLRDIKGGTSSAEVAVFNRWQSMAKYGFLVCLEAD